MLNMTTTQSIELFMTALRGQNYSPKTLRAYGDDLRAIYRLGRGESGGLGQPQAVQPC